MLELDPEHSAGTLRQILVADEQSSSDEVYPPCHGTSLLMASITADAQRLRTLAPAVCLDLGCGFGVVAAHLSRTLPNAFVLASDVQAAAPRAALRTSRRNGCFIEVLHADLLTCFRPCSIGCAVFHVPYVPTSQEVLDEAMVRADFSATWAGGPRGLGVLERLLPMLRRVLEPAGILYILFYEIAEVTQLLAWNGLHAVPCARYKSPAESLYVLRCTFEIEQPRAAPEIPNEMQKPLPLVLVLDCGSVTNNDATADMPALASAMGLAGSEQAAKHGMNEAWQLARVCRDMDAARYWKIALEAAGSPLSSEDAATVAACEECVASTLRVTFDDTIATATYLKAKGALVGIISNHIVSPPWFQECAKAAGLYELASNESLVIVSQEVETAKPKQSIYEIFFEKLQKIEPTIQPGQLLFIDDKERNVATAQSLGWMGLCFNAAKAKRGALADAIRELGFH